MRAAADHSDPVARAEGLVRLFHPRPGDFGSFHAIEPDRVPPLHRGLLEHSSHMTAAMERHHGGPVSLEIVATRGPDGAGGPQRWYAREILLSGPSGGRVQYGIVRIDLGRLPARDAALVCEGRLPLGRILMGAGILCDVEDVALVTVNPGPRGSTLVGAGPAYGRVARILVDRRPAIELLEIVVDSAGV